MANSEIRSSRLQAAVEVKYTVFHPLVVEVSCVLFLDYARWLGQKQNTRNLYHKRMKDSVIFRNIFQPKSWTGKHCMHYMGHHFSAR